MYAVYVTVNVKQGYMEEFLTACVEEGEACDRDEPDCLRFEILRDKNNPNRVCAIEVFTDEQSLKAHWDTPHFKKWWNTVEHMIDPGEGETDLWRMISASFPMSLGEGAQS
jgi:quinol monooxygenase YgiN